MPLDGAAGDEFGSAVALSLNADVIAVGSWRDDDLTSADAGSTYVYSLAAGKWVFSQKLTSPNPEGGERFGKHVAASGERIVIGAHFDDNGGASNAGSVYLFKQI